MPTHMTVYTGGVTMYRGEVAFETNWKLEGNREIRGI